MTTLCIGSAHRLLEQDQVPTPRRSRYAVRELKAGAGVLARFRRRTPKLQAVRRCIRTTQTRRLGRRQARFRFAGSTCVQDKRCRRLRDTRRTAADTQASRCRPRPRKSNRRLGSFSPAQPAAGRGSMIFVVGHATHRRLLGWLLGKLSVRMIRLLRFSFCQAT